MSRTDIQIITDFFNVKLKQDLSNNQVFNDQMRRHGNISNRLVGGYHMGDASTMKTYADSEILKEADNRDPKAFWYTEIIESITLEDIKNLIIQFLNDPNLEEFSNIKYNIRFYYKVIDLVNLLKKIYPKLLLKTLNLCNILKIYYESYERFRNDTSISSKSDLENIKYIIENKLCDTFGTDDTGNIQKDKKKWVIPDGSFASLITAINKNTNSPIDPTIVQYYKDKRSENAWNSSSMQSLSKGTKSFKSWFGRGGKTRKGKSKSRRSKRHCKRRKTKRHRKH